MKNQAIWTNLSVSLESGRKKLCCTQKEVKEVSWSFGEQSEKMRALYSGKFYRDLNSI